MSYNNSHYWNRKAELASYAKMHTLEMETNYSDLIGNSVQNSKIYMEDHIFNQFTGTNNNYISIYLIDADSYNGAIMMKERNPNMKIAIHNFASFKNPGGRFLDGSSAQEESLCHISTLYNVLSRFDSYYKNNSKKMNNGLYYNRAIFSPNILFNNKDFFDVITCAAPNISFQDKDWYRGEPLNQEVVERTVYERCKFVIDVAEDNNIECLITGAFGCGVFRNDPCMIYSSFINAINSRAFGHLKFLIFAVPRNGYSNDNYNKFYNCHYHD